MHSPRARSQTTADLPGPTRAPTNRDVHLDPTATGDVCTMKAQTKPLLDTA